MDKVTHDKINELRQEVDQQWAFDRRKEYLKSQISDLIVEYWLEREKHADYTHRGKMMEQILTKQEMDGILKEVLKHLNEIYYTRLAMQGKPGERITDDEIRQARMFPFTELHPFTKNTALCPFHEDHHPSFHLFKDNTARCFSCGWRGDTIQFVMEKNGRKFHEAVRQLL